MINFFLYSFVYFKKSKKQKILSITLKFVLDLEDFRLSRRGNILNQNFKILKLSRIEIANIGQPFRINNVYGTYIRNP